MIHNDIEHVSDVNVYIHASYGSMVALAHLLLP